MTPLDKAMKVIEAGGFNANQVMAMMAGKYPQEFIKLTKIHPAGDYRVSRSLDVVNLSPYQHSKVMEHLNEGQPVAAIKYIRSFIDVGLLVAKHYIDKYRDTTTSAFPTGDFKIPMLSVNQRNEIRSLLYSNRNIQAIKYTRNTLNITLKEAKSVVDSIRDNL